MCAWSENDNQTSAILYGAKRVITLVALRADSLPVGGRAAAGGITHDYVWLLH